MTDVEAWFSPPPPGTASVPGSAAPPETPRPALQRTLAPAGMAHRASALTKWETAPAARQAHPREEHLLPLMVAVGAAESEIASRVYHEGNFFSGISVSSFMFGGN